MRRWADARDSIQHTARTWMRGPGVHRTCARDRSSDHPRPHRTAQAWPSRVSCLGPGALGRWGDGAATHAANPRARALALPHASVTTGLRRRLTFPDSAHPISGPSGTVETRRLGSRPRACKSGAGEPIAATSNSAARDGCAGATVCPLRLAAARPASGSTVHGACIVAASGARAPPHVQLHVQSRGSHGRRMPRSSVQQSQ